MISFITQPTIGGNQYQVIDTSTDTNIYFEKRIAITGANGERFIFMEHIPIGRNTINFTVDQAWQDNLALLQISVSLEYIGMNPVPFSDNIVHLYILPTTLNIKQN